MSRKDTLTGKGKLKGNRVSHSNIKTSRPRELNLQTQKVVLPNGRVVKLKVSTRTLRTISKKGISSVLKKNNVKF